MDKTFIPDDWVSSTFLKKCYERKGGKSEGFIKTFHREFARHGKKKVRNSNLEEPFLSVIIILEPPWTTWLLFPKKLCASYPQHSNHC